MSAEQTPLTVDAALVRLGQYREHAITWSTASYNDDTERALYRIAEALAAEIERLRAEVAGRVSVETAEAIWRAGVIAGDDAYEPTGRPSRAEVLREAWVEIESLCPDHGRRDETILYCCCAVGDLLTDLADAAERGETQ